ncbi:unnamed protein product [Spirodela intermedia]|uniref:Uncharacterized protein n=1 Tax=Spirodela intermedia TaxID=51605 RepID=A0ABN7EDA1_SPIIN|nr:unnamed protein product [Spirodela intermedia]
MSQGASSSSPYSKRRLFIASSTFSEAKSSRVYDHSLPHSRLATFQRDYSFWLCSMRSLTDFSLSNEKI